MTRTGKIKELDARELTPFLKRRRLPVVVEFWAPWCVLCRQLHALLQEVAPKFAGRITFTRVDIDASEDVAEDYGIDRVPTLLILKRGQVTARLLGRVSREELEAALRLATTDR